MKNLKPYQTPESVVVCIDPVDLVTVSDNLAEWNDDWNEYWDIFA